MNLYINSIKKAWNGKQLTERDYNRLSNLMIIAFAWILLCIVL